MWRSPAQTDSSESCFCRFDNRPYIINQCSSHLMFAKSAAITTFAWKSLRSISLRKAGSQCFESVLINGRIHHSVPSVILAFRCSCNGYFTGGFIRLDIIERGTVSCQLPYRRNLNPDGRHRARRSSVQCCMPHLQQSAMDCSAQRITSINAVLIANGERSDGRQTLLKIAARSASGHPRNFSARPQCRPPQCAFRHSAHVQIVRTARRVSERRSAQNAVSAVLLFNDGADPGSSHLP